MMPDTYDPTRDELVKLSDRLYCAWQCVQMGDPLFIDHEKKVGGVLFGIWQELEDLIDAAKDREDFVKEELKKFTEGFAYRSPHGQVRD